MGRTRPPEAPHVRGAAIAGLAHDRDADLDVTDNRRSHKHGKIVPQEQVHKRHVGQGEEQRVELGVDDGEDPGQAQRQTLLEKVGPF